MEDKKITIRIPSNLHKNLKQVAVTEDISMKDIITNLIENYINKKQGN